MKMVYVICCLIVCFSYDASGNVGNLIKASPKALKAIAVAVGIGSAAGGTAEAAESYEEIKDLDEMLVHLKEQGANLPDAAIYSLFYTLNNDASSVRWADIGPGNKPDVFALVEIEGRGVFLVPDIRHEYSGQSALATLLAKDAIPGNRVAVYILDDDTWSDAAWNQILQTRINFNLSGNTHILQVADVHVNASGQFQLLGSNQVIDGPDYIACAVFSVPSTVDGRWYGQAKLLDAENRDVGRIEIKELNRVPWEKYELIKEKKRKAKFRMVLFGMIGLFATVFVVKATVFKKSSPQV